MIRLRLAVIAVVAGFFVVTAGSLVHAATPYPVGTPTPTPSIAPDSDDLAPGDDAPEALGPDGNGILPGTGGASVYILLAGGALLVVGGAVVYSNRRHQSAH